MKGQPSPAVLASILMASIFPSSGNGRASRRIKNYEWQFVISKSKEGDHARDKDSSCCLRRASIREFRRRPGATSGNVFFGYSYYNADLSTLGRSNLSGWTGSLEGRVFPHSAWGGFQPDLRSESVTILCPGLALSEPKHQRPRVQQLFGPRVSFSVGKLRPSPNLFGLGTSARMTQGRTRPSPPGWRLASITASSAPSPSASKETISKPASIAPLRTTCACRPAFVFRF